MSGRLEGARHVVGRSKALAHVFREILAVAPSPDSVLIRPESGAGKEVVAREIHAQSPRANGPLIVASCASLNDATGEADMFGYTKGAFTGADKNKPGLFQRSEGGTLFLDELGELSLQTQTKLLRALDGGNVRPVGGDETPLKVRVLAATNLDLDEMVATGRFRIELKSRFAEKIHVPPLRERAEDIPHLVAHFIQELRGDRNKKAQSVSATALAKLAAHPWATNNVRELQTAVKRALNRSRETGAEELGPELFELEPSPVSSAKPTADAVSALRKVADALIAEIDSGGRAAAGLKALADTFPEVDLQVQLARAFDSRIYPDKT